MDQAEVASSNPDSPKLMPQKEKWQKIYTIRRRLYFDRVDSEGRRVGTVIVTPCTPDKQKRSELPVPREM